MPSSSPPALRLADTSRPSSGARLRVAAIPPPPRTLSIVERHHIEPFCCGNPLCASGADAEGGATVTCGPALQAVTLLCGECAKGLAEGIKFVRFNKGERS